jgi:hypothetical protein
MQTRPGQPLDIPTSISVALGNAKISETCSPRWKRERPGSGGISNGQHDDAEITEFFQRLQVRRQSPAHVPFTVHPSKPLETLTPSRTAVRE